MRKYLMAAALLAVVGCGEKKDKAGDSSTMAGMPTTAADSTAKADSLKRMMVRDSIVKDSMMKDSIAKAKKP